MIDWWKNTADMSSFLRGLVDISKWQRWEIVFGVALEMDYSRAWTGSSSRIQMGWLTLQPDFKKVLLFSVLWALPRPVLWPHVLCIMPVVVLNILLLFGSKVSMMHVSTASSMVMLPAERVAWWVWIHLQAQCWEGTKWCTLAQTHLSFWYRIMTKEL